MGNPNQMDMEQMMQMAHIFAEMNQAAAPDEAAEEKRSFDAGRGIPRPWDDALLPPRLRALKAAIPYMEPPAGKMLALFLKLTECRQLLFDYDAVPVATDSDQRISRILEAMRPHCAQDEDDQQWLAQLERAAQMQQMMQFMQMMQRQ